MKNTFRSAALGGFFTRTRSAAMKKQNEEQGASPPQLPAFFDLLTRFHFVPEHVVDIGAHRGRWTECAISYFPNATYSLFEPQPALQNELLAFANRHKNVTVYPVGVGSKNGTSSFTLHERADSCTFAYDRLLADNQGFTQVQIPTVSLDDFLTAEQLPRPNMVKIDAEGWDLNVIAGGSTGIAHASVVLVEAAVCNKSFKNCLFSVLSAMRELGHRPFDMTDLNRSAQGALWLLEVAFVKIGDPLDQISSAFAVSTKND
jgi:FkbM family methyltransferase